MAVELIPKEEKARKFAPRISWEIVRANPQIAGAVAVLFAVLLVYGGLLFWNTRTSAAIGDARAAQEELRVERDEALEAEARSFARRTSALKGILDRHIYPSSIFPVLERSLHQFTFIADMSLSVGDARIAVNGRTASLETLGQQIILWEKDPQIIQVDLGTFNPTTEGPISFSAVLFLDSSVFTR